MTVYLQEGLHGLNPHYQGRYYREDCPQCGLKGLRGV